MTQAPLLGVEGAQEQVEDRRLASARRPDQGHGLPRGHVEIELAQRWPLATVVAERYPLEADGERLPARRQWVRWLNHLRLISEEREDALRGGDSIQALVVEPAQLAHGAEDLVPQQEDDEQAADADVPLHGPQGADGQGHGGADRQWPSP